MQITSPPDASRYISFLVAPSHLVAQFAASVCPSPAFTVGDYNGDGSTGAAIFLGAAAGAASRRGFGPMSRSVRAFSPLDGFGDHRERRRRQPQSTPRRCISEGAGRKMSTPEPKLRPSRAACSANHLAAKSRRGNDFRLIRQSEMVASTKLGIGFANGSRSASHMRQPSSCSPKRLGLFFGQRSRRLRGTLEIGECYEAAC